MIRNPSQPLFENANAGKTAVLKLNLGKAIQAIRIDYAGTMPGPVPATAADFTNVKLRVGGILVREWKTLDHALMFNQAMKRGTFTAGIPGTIFLASPELSSIEQQAFTAMGTKDVDLITLSMDVAVGMTDIVLRAWTDLSDGDEDIGLILTTRLYEFNVNAAGVVEMSGIIPESPGLLARIAIIDPSAKLTALRLEMNGEEILGDIPIAIHDATVEQNVGGQGRDLPANFHLIDFVQDGDLNSAPSTAKSSLRSFRLKGTFSAGCTVYVYVEQVEEFRKN